MEPTSVKKSTCEKYFLRFNDPSCIWAEIVIDDDGTFNAQSDNGDFQYIWRNHGRKSFKHFILELARDSHYFLKKVSECSYFDADATEKLWKSKVIEYRKDYTLSKERARELWDNIVDLFSGICDKTYIEIKVYESDMFEGIEEPWYDFELINDYPHGAKHFANVIMPEFAKIIKTEIDTQ